ncbi:tyrosine-protein phosphatase [Pedobacter hartonius]|uniref:Protein-tyrosine phosphatase n=1 Tax=Pedobacter hartonius TaxID=425514 RepID=A0A1H4G539_9SPHI|nr:tyrosine-protein phosphatase [Pedobacter hartonius]SEB04726.1 protein-tyrosine phosphatase [Pedobacter hartonius]
MVKVAPKIDSFKDRYRPIFDSLLTLNADSALLFHCTGGKDRTGTAAALIEYALGVDQGQIIDDYVLTNQYRKKYNKVIADMLVEKYKLPAKRVADYGIAKPAFMEATFDEITKKYGSVANFMKNELGLTDDKLALLRAKYLK